MSRAWELFLQSPDDCAHASSPSDDLHLESRYNILSADYNPNLPAAEFGRETSADLRAIIEFFTSLVDEQFPNSSEAEKDIIRDNLEVALLEGHLSRRVSESLHLPSPVRDLSDTEVEAIRGIGRRNPWEGRSLSDTRSPAEWIFAYYHPYLPGMLKHHLRQADLKLYNTLSQNIARNGVPAGLDIPTSAENAARKRAAELRASLQPNTNTEETSQVCHDARARLVSSSTRSSHDLMS